MKYPYYLLASFTLLTSCTEKTEIAARVLAQKAEQKFVELAGETEVATELYRKQYLSLKERLVNLKTLQKTYMQEIESVQGDARRTQLYQGLLSKVETRIPEAEKELREFHTFFEKQVEELKFLKEETNAYKAAAMISDNGSETAFEKRKESIKALEGNLKKHAKRAESLLEVQDLVKTF